jgi:hypothetical protein
MENPITVKLRNSDLIRNLLAKRAELFLYARDPAIVHASNGNIARKEFYYGSG